MHKSRTKVRILKSLNHHWVFSLYKLSVEEFLEWKEDGIGFKYHPDIKQDEILSISIINPGGLNIGTWIKLEFYRNDEKKEIYLSSGKSFGLFVYENQRFENDLRSRYFRNE